MKEIQPLEVFWSLFVRKSDIVLIFLSKRKLILANSTRRQGVECHRRRWSNGKKQQRTLPVPARGDESTTTGPTAVGDLQSST